MKEILYNYDNLTKEDMDEVVVRVKALILNDDDELLLVNSHGKYHFPGGHVEEGETLNQALKREINEETGIELEDEEPFLIEKIVYYTKNYNDSGKNRENDINFYIIKTNKDFNINNLDLDEYEKQGNFHIKRFHINDVIEELRRNVKENDISEVIYDEMIDVIKEYIKIR